MKKKKKKSNLTDVLRKIVLVLSIAVFLGCGGYLFMIYFPNDETPNMDINSDILFNDFENQKIDFLQYVRELKNENDDLFGFMSIKDTKINYPVLLYKDNDYYLTHNFYRKYDRHGALFLDAYTNTSISLNWLVYGHSMKDGTMFGGLHKFSKKAYYQKHSEIIFTTLDESAIYDIFAVVYTQVYDDNEHFRYHIYNNLNTESDYNDYVKNMKKLSSYDTGITPQFGDQLITMSTCVDSSPTSKRRLVIVARKRNQANS